MLDFSRIPPSALFRAFSGFAKVAMAGGDVRAAVRRTENWLIAQTHGGEPPEQGAGK